MKARSLGLAAKHVASHGGEAKVIGVTSRGVFLAIEQRVMFISFEQWRGPLTINVDRSLVCLMGDKVRLSPTRLIFPAFEVDLSAAEIWQPTAPLVARAEVDQHDALKQLAVRVLARKAPDGFGRLLPHLLDLPEKPALSASEAARLARLIEVREASRQPDFDRAAELIESLLGLGRGLTPSGDDVTIGWLLARRMNSQPVHSNALKRVVEAAYHRTTAISANLIDCAANGEADERLIAVLDHLAAGTPALEDCVTGLLAWGQSSGVDALIGLALALNAV